MVEESVDGADADHGTHVGNEGHEDLRRQTHDAACGGARGSGKIDDDATDAACMFENLCRERFGGGQIGVQRLGIESDHLDGRVATGDWRTKGAYQAGALIAGAEEEGQQAVGSGIDQQNALTARREHTAQGGYEAGFAHATGQRKDRENGSARGRGRWRRLRGHIVFKDAAQGEPARHEVIARALQRVNRRRRKRRRADGFRTLRHEPGRAASVFAGIG